MISYEMSYFWNTTQITDLKRKQEEQVRQQKEEKERKEREEKDKLSQAELTKIREWNFCEFSSKFLWKFRENWEKIGRKRGKSWEKKMRKIRELWLNWKEKERSRWPSTTRIFWEFFLIWCKISSVVERWVFCSVFIFAAEQQIWTFMRQSRMYENSCGMAATRRMCA